MYIADDIKINPPSEFETFPAQVIIMNHPVKLKTVTAQLWTATPLTLSVNSTKFIPRLTEELIKATGEKLKFIKNSDSAIVIMKLT